MQAAADRGDEGAVRRARGEAIEAGLRLGRNGEIASPAALCRAVGAPREAYGRVLAGEAGGDDEERVRRALELAGDRRFTPARSAS